MKEEKGTGAEAESLSQLVAKEDNKGNFWATSSAYVAQVVLMSFPIKEKVIELNLC